MQGLCKYSLLFLILLVSFSTIIYAEYDNCKGTIRSEDVPCHILLPYNISTLVCTNVVAGVYNITDNIYNQTMTAYNDFFCNATFNQSSVGTYTILYSTGDTGTIVVEEGNKMIYLLYFALVVIIGLFVVGQYWEMYEFVSISGILTLCFGIFVFMNGFNGLQNLIVEAISIIAILIGFYFFIGPVLEYLEVNMW